MPTLPFQPPCLLHHFVWKLLRHEVDQEEHYHLSCIPLSYNLCDPPAECDNLIQPLRRQQLFGARDLIALLLG